MSKRNNRLPIPVRRVLAKLGQDIRNARRRRRIQVKTMAQRASITTTTLHKLEKGDPGVSIGIFATALFVLGMLDRLAELADAMHDRLGMDLEEEILPKRIRHSTQGRTPRETRK